MCANSEGFGETVRMRRLAWALAGHLGDKYHNLMSWLIWYQIQELQDVNCKLNKGRTLTLVKILPVDTYKKYQDDFYNVENNHLAILKKLLVCWTPTLYFLVG